ncbi:MAG: hypothetical protein UHI81_02940 [Olegusella sp.]|nr:hypothetical protein [Olegusella sp.]
MSGENKMTYEVGGVEMSFYRAAFNDCFRRNARLREGVSLTAYEQKAADVIGVSPSAVHAWRVGVNAPADIDRIKSLATFWDIDFTTLLVPVKKGKNMREKYTDRQIEALRRIYVAIIDFLDEFDRTMGFNNYWFDIVEKEGIAPGHAEARLYEIVDNKHLDVVRAIKREGFDLRDTEIYDRIMDYAWEDLVNIYDGKLSYAYRFEEGVELAEPNSDSTKEQCSEAPEEDDYQKALKSLHSILDEFI